MSNGYNMPSGEYRRVGKLWLHLSESEFIWSLAAACSVGVIIGLVVALAATAHGVIE